MTWRRKWQRGWRGRYEALHVAPLLSALPKASPRDSGSSDKNYELLKSDASHPSLHIKKLGGKKQLWSVRVGAHYRALGMEGSEGTFWFWIGTHSEYDRLLAMDESGSGIFGIPCPPAAMIAVTKDSCPPDASAPDASARVRPATPLVPSTRGTCSRRLGNASKALI